MEIASGYTYDVAQRRRTFIKWSISILVAVVMNAAMFLALPSFFVLGGGRAELMEVLPRVNVIRIKHKENPPQKKTPPPKPQHEQKKPDKNPLPQKRPVAMPKPTLPFHLSPAMPTAPTTLQFSPLEAGTFTLSGDLDGVDAAELDDVLMPLSRVPPVYPIRAKRRGQEGWVKVRFLVNEHGEVSNVAIVDAEPEKVFDKSVIRCVQRWRFRPGTVEGVPVKAWGETTITFELED